jgi:hypothetical protein
VIFGRGNADLIEAGLNEGAVAARSDLWGLFVGRDRYVCVLRHDRRKRTPMFSTIWPEMDDARRHRDGFPVAARRQRPTQTRGHRVGACEQVGDAGATDGDRGFHRQIGWRHDVSHRNGDDGWPRSAARRSVATTRMTPPHSGHAEGATFACDAAVSSVAFSARLIRSTRADRQRASFAARQPLAMKPK